MEETPMARRVDCLVSLLFILQVSVAQDLFQSDSQLAKKAEAESYAIPGCRLLWKEEAEVQQYLSAHPEMRTLGKISKTQGWGFKVGDTRTWWATNLQTKTEYLVPSTCRAIGVNAYIFAEDSLWTSGRITQAGVDSIRVAFDVRTPASSQKGIFQYDVETFGNPPDFDNDPKIIILILDIKDGYAGSGGYTAGYFFSVNEYRDGTFAGRKSNEAEIYYVDANPGNLATASGLATAASITAHEFQHMIHFNYDPNEITFVNESCSETAMLVCGYDSRDKNLYTDTTDVYLLQWTGSLADYSRASRWGLYLWNQFPNGYLKLLVANKSTGVLGINNSLALYPTSRRFNDIFSDWLVANQLNDATVDSRYAYTYAGVLSKPRATLHVSPNTGARTDGVARFGADYISFVSGTNLSINFAATSSDVHIKAIEIGPASRRVVEVLPNAQFSEPDFGTTYKNITFVVINSSPTNDAVYSYQATGTGVTAVELKWDDTEPQGYLRLAPLDTLCVAFDAVAGARLDSIRVALRRAGTVQGGVWRFTGASRPTPLGSPLAVPVTASTTVTPPVLNPSATYPYEIPYPNWRTIDLRSYNISTDQPFAVGFWLASDTSGDARVMTTRYQSSSSYHSYTYLHNPSSGVPGWYYISASASEIHLYLVRAYVSSIVTGVKEVVEVVPSSFALQQNYPNPFNPSTTIRYSVPAKGQVRLRIFDLAGRVVATLVDQDQPAGIYSVDWHGAADGGVPASSGVYFYRLEGAGYQIAQKMVLLR